MSCGPQDALLNSVERYEWIIDWHHRWKDGTNFQVGETVFYDPEKRSGLDAPSPDRACKVVAVGVDKVGIIQEGRHWDAPHNAYRAFPHNLRKVLNDPL